MTQEDDCLSDIKVIPTLSAIGSAVIFIWCIVGLICTLMSEGFTLLFVEYAAVSIFALTVLGFSIILTRWS